MTADILIHKGSVVPVGEDQLVHLEIAREIVRRFRTLYGDLFPEPQPLIENAVRIPSLAGDGKMSKSDGENTFISMQDTPEEIHRKVKKAFSDPKRQFKHQPGHPTIAECNVYHLHSFFTDSSLLPDIETSCLKATRGCVDCKKILAESLHEMVVPFQDRLHTLSDADVLDVLHEGGNKAREKAEQVIVEVRDAMGIRMI